jgi:hypothetical protein
MRTARWHSRVTASCAAHVSRDDRGGEGGGWMVTLPRFAGERVRCCGWWHAVCTLDGIGESGVIFVSIYAEGRGQSWRIDAAGPQLAGLSTDRRQHRWRNTGGQ